VERGASVLSGRILVFSVSEVAIGTTASQIQIRAGQSEAVSCFTKKALS